MTKLVAVTATGLMEILVLGVVVMIAAIAGGVASAQNCNGAVATGGPLPIPPSGMLNAGQMVRYFVQTGEEPDAAAGIVGNLVQESGDLEPTISDGAGGGGLAQWSIGWYHTAGPAGTLSLDAFASAHHLAPDTDRAQLAFIVYDLRTAAAFFKAPPEGTLQSNLQSAPDPGTAATMFETGYEGCSGVTGWMQVTAGSLCDDSKRRGFAQEALQQANLNSRSPNASTSPGISSSSQRTTTSFTTSSTQPVSTACAAGIGSAPITPGPTGRILPSGIAEAPQDAPPAVKKMIAAGNAIVDTFYSQERRPGMLSHVEDSYDCSGSTDFVLYNSGFSDSPLVNPYGTATAGDSSLLESFGLPGPGRWVDVYGSSGHAFIIVAGLAFDTSYQGLAHAPTSVRYDLQPGDNDPGGPDSGPRWFVASQILPSQLADGEDWHERHPPGL